MKMAKSVGDNVEDALRVNDAQMSKAFKINWRTRESNEVKTYTGEVTQTSPQEIRRSDVN